jgi:hypothetical protein
MIQFDGAFDDAGAEEHAVLGGSLDSVAVGNPEDASRLDPLGDAPVFGTIDQFGESSKRILVGAEIEGAHVRSAGAQRRNHRDAVAKSAASQDFRQDVLQRSVAAIHDQKVHFLAREFRERFGHDARVLGLDMENVWMASQEAEHAAHLFLALARTQIIDDANSQEGLPVSLGRARGDQPFCLERSSEWVRQRRLMGLVM